ncbi:MAG: hypothetical protein Q7S79_00415 [bacterium]|nr:hypothetical protein [bacterium]
MPEVAAEQLTQKIDPVDFAEATLFASRNSQGQREIADPEELAIPILQLSSKERPAATAMSYAVLDKAQDLLRAVVGRKVEWRHDLQTRQIIRITSGKLSPAAYDGAKLRLVIHTPLIRTAGTGTKGWTETVYYLTAGIPAIVVKKVQEWPLDCEEYNKKTNTSVERSEASAQELENLKEQLDESLNENEYIKARRDEEMRA